VQEGEHLLHQSVDALRVQLERSFGFGQRRGAIDFLGASAAWTAGLALADEKKPVSPNEKVVVALIGCGGMGRADLHDFMRLPDFEIAALCDVDPSHIEHAMNDAKRANRPTDKIRTDKDFRRIVERKDIDAVIVGTPDNWHAYVLIAACANNKDVYCEKPMVQHVEDGKPEPDWRVDRYRQRYACDNCGRSFGPLNPHHFAFNSALGWCPACEGLGGPSGGTQQRQPQY